MSIEEEIQKILEENNDDSWQTRSIKVLALCSLEQNKNLCVLRKEVKMLKWMISAVIALIVANLVIIRVV